MSTIFLVDDFETAIEFGIFFYYLCSVVLATIIDKYCFSIAEGLCNETVNASWQFFFFVIGANNDAYFHQSNLVTVYPNPTEGKEKVLLFVEEIIPQGLKHRFFHWSV